MGIRTYKPITPGLRQRVSLDFSDLTKGVKPEKSLTSGLTKKSGRSRGTISVRHKGGGHKRRYREIDFKRDKVGIAGTVRSIEYDPNRSANIALVLYGDGEKRYIIAPRGIKKGASVMSGPSAPLETGNALPLENIPLGFTVHNIELTLGKGAQMARSAGASALIARAGTTLPSGFLRGRPAWCSRSATRQ